MDKKKKVGENKKNYVKKVNKENNIVLSQMTKKYIKIIMFGLAGFAGAASIFVFGLGIYVIFKVITMPTYELVHNNFVVNFISNLNGCSFDDAINIIESSVNKFLFVFIDIIIPVIGFVTIMVLLIILARNILNFIENITYENELYNEKNLIEIKKNACLFLSILTISFLIFESPSFIVYLLFVLFVYIVLDLFNCVVKCKKSG